MEPRKLVSGKNLHDAVHALGLTRYSIDDINEMAAWRDRCRGTGVVGILSSEL